MKFFVKDDICYIDRWVVAVNTISVEFTENDISIVIKSRDTEPQFPAIEVNIDTLEKEDTSFYIDRADVELSLPEFFFCRFKLNFIENLTENGDGTGNRYANQNFSSNPTKFYYQHQLGSSSVKIEKLIITIEDEGTFDAAKYANNIAIDDGILFEKRDSMDNVLVDFTANTPIVRNVDFDSLGFNVVYDDLGTGANFLIATFDFKGGLTLKNGEQLVLLLQDNYSKLNTDGHFFKIQGSI